MLIALLRLYTFKLLGMGLKAVRLLVKASVVVFSFVVLAFSIAAMLSSNTDPNLNVNSAFIGLALPMILLIALVLVVFLIFRKSFWFIIPLIAIAVNYQYVSSMIQINVFTKHDTAANKSSVKAATYNVHGFRHIRNDISVNYIANYMSGENVSILCMQEFSSHSLFNLNEVAGAFDFLPYSTLIDNSSPKAGLVIFSLYPIKSIGMLEIESLSNGVLWADIELPDGLMVRVINAHLQTTGISRYYNLGFRKNIKIMGDNLKLRARHANILNAFIDSSKTPVILCGDFNDTPSSYTYKKAKGNLIDGFRDAGSGLGSTFMHKSSMLRIDYIMYSSHLKGVRYYSDTKKWSDHNPIVAELEYRN